MNDNAKKWVEKLRTPGLRQTRGVLEDEDGQCCLGVACELYVEAHPKYSYKRVVKDNIYGIRDENDAYYFMAYGEEEEDSMLPEEIMKWLGMSTSGGVFEFEEEERQISDSLAERNDAGDTFAEIADAIEEYAEQLFSFPIENIGELSKDA